VLFYFGGEVSKRRHKKPRSHWEDAVNCVSKISDRDFGNFALKVNKEIFCCGGCFDGALVPVKLSKEYSSMKPVTSESVELANQISIDYEG